jgi:hypothetical protein
VILDLEISSICRENIDGKVVIRYQTQLGNVTRFSFTVTSDGKIAQIYWW